VITVSTGNDVVKYTATTDSTVGSIDWVKDLTLNAGAADTIDLTVSVAAVVASQASNLASSGLTESAINGLLNVTNGTLTNKLSAAAGGLDVAILTTTDTKTYLVVDADDSGTFTTAADMLIEITGSTLTSVTTASFV
jgi:hypothetical protein